MAFLLQLRKLASGTQNPYSVQGFQKLSAFGSHANVKSKGLCWIRKVLNFGSVVFAEFRLCHKLSAVLGNKRGRRKRDLYF